MKAYIIRIKDNEISEKAAQRCLNSLEQFNIIDIEPELFDAVTPDVAEGLLLSHGIKWTYPWIDGKVDLKTGLKLNPYKTADRHKRIACFLSHYTLWNKSIEDDEPILVLEHDAIFIRPFFPQFTLDSKYGIIGINNPLGATRRPDVFDSQIQTMRGEHLDVDRVLPVPSVDSFDIPQGLAGNSAYAIKPEAARKLVEAVKDNGAWPNDAIMCKQILPGILGVTSKYYTKVQGTRSTTSL